jgi:hypothetical protein
MAFPHGIAGLGATWGGGGIAVHIPNRRRAVPGTPKGRVAPVHGPETWIGTDDPQFVAQIQAVQRLAELGFRTPRRHSPCTSAPMSNAHLRIGNGLLQTALESGLRTRGSKHTVDHSLMTGRGWRGPVPPLAPRFSGPPQERRAAGVLHLPNPVAGVAAERFPFGGDDPADAILTGPASRELPRNGWWRPCRRPCGPCVHLSGDAAPAHRAFFGAAAEPGHSMPMTWRTAMSLQGSGGHPPARG